MGDAPADVVNAYYHPVRNEIVFPAGILQPPMFDADADDAVNFGGIGTVSRTRSPTASTTRAAASTPTGFRDWWQEADARALHGAGDLLAAQFDDYVAVGDVHVNGRLTLGENIADLGGLALSSRAHARVSAGSPDDRRAARRPSGSSSHATSGGAS